MKILFYLNTCVPCHKIMDAHQKEIEDGEIFVRNAADYKDILKEFGIRTVPCLVEITPGAEDIEKKLK